MRKTLVFLLVACAAVVRADNYLDALDKLQTGDKEGAIQRLQADIAKDPGAVQSNVLLTEVLLGMQRVDDARKVAEDALAKKANEAEFHRIVGDVRFRGGDIFGADTEYKAAVKLDSKDARALLGEARVFRAAAINRKAALLISEAHTLDPDDPATENAQQQIELDSPEAIARWERLLAKGSVTDPSSAIALRARVAEAKQLAGKSALEITSPYSHHQIPLGLLMDGKRFTGLSVTVAIGGAKSELLLDTGASGILIGKRMAQRAGVTRLAEVEVGGVGNKGPAKGWLGYAEQMQIGDVQFRNCIVRVSESDVSEGGGLIGTDVFRRFLVKLNFAQHRIDLDPLPGPAWDGKQMVDRYSGPELSEYAQFLRIRHYILIPTRISDGPPVLFLLDTGAGKNMISTNTAPSVTRLRDNSRERVKGLSGEVKMMYSADKVTLEFAAFRQVNQDLTAFDLSGFCRNAGTEITGIMGLQLLTLFSEITLDYRDGRIKFEYKR